MDVFTTDLMNYIRCYRFAALDRGNRDRLNGSQSQKFHYVAQHNDFSVSPDLPETTGKETDESKLYFQTMEPYRKQYLDFAKAKITRLFPGRISEDYRYRHPFESDLTLVARADYVIENDKELVVVLLHQATSNRLLEHTYTTPSQKQRFFIRNKEGIHVFSPIRKETESGDYAGHLSRLLARHEESGRMIYDAAFNHYVIAKAKPGKHVRTVLGLLDSEYVRNSDGLTSEVVALFETTRLTTPMQEAIETDLYRMLNHIRLNDDSRCQLVKNECQKDTPFACPYTQFCFDHVPKEHSIFAYINQHQGFREGPHRGDRLHDTYELINDGVVDMQDIPISWLQREVNLMQRYCVENDYTFFHKQKLRDKLDALVYPLYYLDFEAFPCILPRFAGEKCYSQSLFQFSLDVQNSKATPPADFSHYEYLAPDLADHRYELIAKLLESIPEGKASIIVYNQAFEDNRLKEMTKLYPQFARQINNLRSRLFDLLKVVKNDYTFYIKKGYSKAEAQTYNFYHPDLDGNYSLKKVLPVVAEDRYLAMPISEGISAYLNYARMESVPEGEKMLIRQNLLDYCHQDTLSMAIILAYISRYV